MVVAGMRGWHELCVCEYAYKYCLGFVENKGQVGHWAMSAHVPHASLIRWSVPTPRHMQDGDTALASAADYGQWGVMRLLVRRKADPNIGNSVSLIIECLTPTANTNPDP